MLLKKLMIISDFIEGQPVVASVRFSEIMKHLEALYELYIVNDFKYGSQPSLYSDFSLKYTTIDSKFSNQLSEQKNKKGLLEKWLRNKFLLKIWRSYKFSNTLFNKNNKEFYQNLFELLSSTKIDYIFVTVPDIYVIYIMKFIKENFPHIVIIVEVRDILNHNIGEGNPTTILKKAEKTMINYSDGIIALTTTIADYYKKLSKGNVDIQMIRNGFYGDNFLSCQYEGCIKNKKKLTFAHIGSIYKGRNIKDFIKGLILFYKKTGVEVVFNIVGVIDNEAYEDISKIFGIKEIEINIVGVVPHEKALDYLKNCDVSVIITHKTGSNYAIPGKTFEYIGACKPIIAVTEDPELKRFLEPKYGECANHNSEDVRDKLIKITQAHYDFSDRELYSREKQVESIINFLESKVR